MLAKVVAIQVGGLYNCESLEDAVDHYQYYTPLGRSKIHFTIELPDGSRKSITIRQEGDKTFAYGDFEGLPSFFDYAAEP